MKDKPLDPLAPAPFRVMKAKRETSDTFTLELAPAEGNAAFPFAAGQFNMLYAFGVGEAPISISGDPSAPGHLVHTIRDVGVVTGALRKLKRGEIMGVRGPFGAGWPMDQAAGHDLVIVAGGIGLAPLRPVIYQVIAERVGFGEIFILYGARTPGDLLFRRELEKWRSRFDLDVRVTVDNAAAGWRGNVGVVTTLISRANFDPSKVVAMVCGPEVMMRFAVQELRQRGLDSRTIYLSMERNMRCGVGLCGHCQFGPHFVCKDGPVFRLDRIQDLFWLREI
jgi:NAD(P)H-flavin reductase